MFDHWELVNGSISDKNCNLVKIITEIRKRKGLKEEIPDATYYLDKI